MQLSECGVRPVRPVLSVKVRECKSHVHKILRGYFSADC